MPQQRAVEDPLHSVNSVATVRSATMIGRSWRCGLLQEIPSESLNIARFHEPDLYTIPGHHRSRGGVCAVANPAPLPPLRSSRPGTASTMITKASTRGTAAPRHRTQAHPRPVEYGRSEYGGLPVKPVVRFHELNHAVWMRRRRCPLCAMVKYVRVLSVSALIAPGWRGSSPNAVFSSHARRSTAWFINAPNVFPFN
jgi:hypothetical protein